MMLVDGPLSSAWVHNSASAPRKHKGPAGKMSEYCGKNGISLNFSRLRLRLRIYPQGLVLQLTYSPDCRARLFIPLRRNPYFASQPPISKQMTIKDTNRAPRDCLALKCAIDFIARSRHLALYGAIWFWANLGNLLLCEYRDGGHP